MRILDKYILRSIIKTFLSTIFIFCFLYVLIDIASNLNEIIDRKVPLVILAQYYLSFLPIIIVQTSPIACLISSLLTYGQMNNNNEVIAMRTGGLNFWGITKPALLFAFFVSVLIFFVNERFVPQATTQSEQIRNKNIILEVDSKRKQKEKIKNLTFYGLKNRLYFIDTFAPNTYEMKGITIIEQDNKQNIRKKIVALKGVWTGIAWKAYNCQIALYNPQSLQEKSIKFYRTKLLDIPEQPKDFLRQRLNVSAMNTRQLFEYIIRFSNSGATRAINNLLVDLHQKIAYPFGNMVILLVGLPLALMTGRRKALTFTTLGISIAIGFLYYVTNAVSLALGKGEILPPIVAAWLTPFLFFLIAIYLIKTKF